MTAKENSKHSILGNRTDYKKVISIKRRNPNFLWHIKGKNNYGAKRIKCLNNGKEYDFILQAARELNLDNSSITKVCKNKKESVKGYKFIYI